MREFLKIKARSLSQFAGFNLNLISKPVANILGLTEAIRLHTEHLSNEEIQQLCTHLQSSATELDTFIRALNALMEQTERSTAG